MKKENILTFWQIIRNYHIEIPIIQRDYAQGRKDIKTTMIRNNFLSELLSLITDPVATKEFDYVYGFCKKDGVAQTFIPLDGQQRLTTLFLIHWYLAPSDERGFVDEFNHSRFTYKVRPSSKDFCRFLVTLRVPRYEGRFSDYIKDQYKFALSWEKDPTVKGMLVMLDAIDERLKGYSDQDRLRFWERLTSSENPPITFRFLDLDEFSMSDELYIKMNARGKALTEFENFKSYLDEKIEKVFESDPAFVEVWKENIDGIWTDLFWSYRNRTDVKENEIDDEYMRFFKSILYSEIVRNREIVSDKYMDDISIPGYFETTDRDEIINKLLVDLSSDTEIPNSVYEKLELFTDFTLKRITNILNGFSSRNKDGSTWIVANDIFSYLKDINFNIADTNFAEKNDRSRTILDAAVSRRQTYKERSLFYALSRFLAWQPFSPESANFNEFMRIVRNFVENTEYNNIDNFESSLLAIDELLANSNQLVTYIASGGFTKGFTGEQRKEEQLKASFLIKDDQPEWRTLIREAEENAYFIGQIAFLFNFADIEMETISMADPAIFRSYKDKMCGLFGPNGVQGNKSHFFEASLLALGYDMIQAKGDTWCFGVDFDRDLGWKTLLRGHKREFVKKLVDDPDFDISDIPSSLEKILKKAAKSISDWRRFFIEYPEIINECGTNKLIRYYSPNEIYLLSKSNLRGRHKEYYSFAFFKKYLENNPKLDSFEIWYYDVSGNQENPSAVVEYERSSGNNFVLDIEYENDKSEDGAFSYNLYFYLRKKQMTKMIEEIGIETLGFFPDEKGKRYYYPAKDEKDAYNKLLLVCTKIEERKW